jgi:radical SAM superfamily enzyme YgiQ (UPF0313 family)
LISFSGYRVVFKAKIMRLYLINPHSGLGDIIYKKKTFWSKYRIWKPLGLLTVAGLTPSDWDISVFDENLYMPDYSSLPDPDLVGITAFSSQASRAYEISEEFRKRKVPVIMGGIHATLYSEEALKFTDSIVLGEAEGIWSKVLDDVCNGRLSRKYISPRMDLDYVKPARHDLLASGYALGMVQTSRGCPFRCSYCSVRSFNGPKYRMRPVHTTFWQSRQRIYLTGMQPHISLSVTMNSGLL